MEGAPLPHSTSEPSGGEDAPLPSVEGGRGFRGNAIGVGVGGAGVPSSEVSPDASSSFVGGVGGGADDCDGGGVDGAAAVVGLLGADAGAGRPAAAFSPDAIAEARRLSIGAGRGCVVRAAAAAAAAREERRSSLRSGGGRVAAPAVVGLRHSSLNSLGVVSPRGGGTSDSTSSISGPSVTNGSDGFLRDGDGDDPSGKNEGQTTLELMEAHDAVSSVDLGVNRTGAMTDGGGFSSSLSSGSGWGGRTKTSGRSFASETRLFKRIIRPKKMLSIRVNSSNRSCPKEQGGTATSPSDAGRKNFEDIMAKQDIMDTDTSKGTPEIENSVFVTAKRAFVSMAAVGAMTCIAMGVCMPHMREEALQSAMDMETRAVGVFRSFVPGIGAEVENDGAGGEEAGLNEGERLMEENGVNLRGGTSRGTENGSLIPLHAYNTAQGPNDPGILIPNLADSLLVDVLGSPNDCVTPFLWALEDSGWEEVMDVARGCVEGGASEPRTDRGLLSMAASIFLSTSDTGDIAIAPSIYAFPPPPSPENGSSDIMPRYQALAVFRHPVHRAHSAFLRLRTSGEIPPEMTFMDFAKHGVGHIRDNIVVRSLCRKLSSETSLNMEDFWNKPVTPVFLEAAKEVLRRKVVVGLADQVEESGERFRRFLESNSKVAASPPPCLVKALTEVDQPPPPLLVSEEFYTLSERDWADLGLYHYVQELFREQSVLFTAGEV